MSYVQLKQKDNIAWIEWDNPESKANVLSSKALSEFSAIVDHISNSNGKIQTACLISKKPSVFIAGADLNEIQKLKTEKDFSNQIEQAHQLFKKMENSSCIFISAIHGACLGGGAELTLACDYRMASLHFSTQIGFPEVNLGLIPGFGGCVRLSRWIGFLPALKLITTGKSLSAQKAHRVGLVDQVVQSFEIKEKVIQLAQGPLKKARKRRRVKKFLDHCMDIRFIRSLIVFVVRKQILKKTKGFYPAPVSALRLMHKIFSWPLDKALEEEKKVFCTLAVTETSKNLIRLFFMMEKVKKQKGFSSEKKLEIPPVKNVGVIGAGVMGRGIAYICACKDIKTRLQDTQKESLIRAQEEISHLFSKQLKRKKINVYEEKSKKALIQYTMDWESFSSMDIVVEAIVEDLSQKQKLIQNISQHLKKDAVFATNTSSLSVTKIAKAHPRPSQFVGLHFFNPVHRMPLVEIIRGAETSDETTAQTFQFAKQLGKIPVIVKDRPGFLVNRLLMPWLSEALWMWGEGMDIRSIDSVFSKILGLPMGPFRLMDEVGLDVCGKVIQSFQSSGLKLKTPIFANQLGQEGCLGKKTLLGFYHYTDQKQPRSVHQKLEDQFRSSLKGPEPLNKEVCLKRGLYRMINECGFVLEEQVVDSPFQVDLAMIMGAGFPPFHGGPLRYADTLGLESIVQQLKDWTQKGMERFQQSSVLEKTAVSKQNFYSG